MLQTLPFLVCLGSGLIGGVFFAFSTFVVKALAQLPVAEAVAAMQRINVVVLNAVFLGAFVGTAVLAGICILAAFFPWGTNRSFLLLLAGVSYLLGSFGVTAGFNVPRNERLAPMEPSSKEAAEYWPVYLRQWLFWNHVRTVGSVVSAGCSAAALAI